MDFTLPRTKDEMYATLKQLFHYYRVEREGYAGVTLEELKLDRMQFVPLNEDELRLKASRSLMGVHHREIENYKNEITEKITENTARVSAFVQERNNLLNQINVAYSESENKIKEQAMKNGLINSSILVDKLASLETAKNNKIADTNSLYSEKITKLNSELEWLYLAREQAEEYFSNIHDKEYHSKTLELKQEQDEIERTVFKYNNSLEEKELKYRNSMAQKSVELKLKFMEIQSGEFTKDELVDMGYYDDVLACVCGYYDNLTPLSAFQDIVNEERLMVFLDDYYQHTVYMYKLRAGA